MSPIQIRSQSQQPRKRCKSPLTNALYTWVLILFSIARWTKISSRISEITMCTPIHVAAISIFVLMYVYAYLDLVFATTNSGLPTPPTYYQRCHCKNIWG